MILGLDDEFSEHGVEVCVFFCDDDGAMAELIDVGTVAVNKVVAEELGGVENDDGVAVLLCDDGPYGLV